MKFTDIFIRRPVLSSVVSLLILLLGLQALYKMPVRQYPELQNTVITVTTTYPGASAELMKGFITTPIEQAIASADGLDYLTSQSTQGQSLVSAYIKLDYDPNAALTEIMAKVAQTRNVLPRAANSPVILKSTGSTTALLYVGFLSPEMTGEQITEYLTRVVQPQIQTISGVAEAHILGAKTFAMRVWLNPRKMAAVGVSPSDVATALKANNYQAAAGQVKGYYVVFDISAKTDLSTVQEFKDLVVKSDGDTLIRLKNIADVALGPQNPDSSVSITGEKAVTIAVTATPTANPLSVISAVRKVLPAIENQLPPTLKLKVMYDATKFIRASIDEVFYTIGETALIVIVVIFLFLGSLRAMLIPMLTIPLSLIGVGFFMLAMGFSINLLTLLAMVLAIGLVVDDAIVVVENIQRHIEEGLSPLEAALAGAREIATPVISMTITLAAVYAPIGFIGGLTGALFKEFAFALAGSVIISGVVALTLSPMMCSKILHGKAAEARFAVFLDQAFLRLRGRYEQILHGVLDYRPVMLVMAATVLGSIYFLYTGIPKELAPTEDQGVIFSVTTGPKYANLDYMDKFTPQMNRIYASHPEMDTFFVVNGRGGVNHGFSGLILKPWNERKRSQAEILKKVQGQLNGIAGLKVISFPLPSLPGSTGGLPVQFVITASADYQTIFHVLQRLEDAARKSGLFMIVDSNLKFNNPELEIEIDRGKAAQLGISMEELGGALGTLLGGNYVNRFSVTGRSYEVIPQLPRKFRLRPELLKQIHVHTASGTLVPIGNVVTLKTMVKPNALTEFQQLNSATLQAVMLPGVSLGQGLGFLKQEAQKIFPRGFSYNYKGESRQFVEEGSKLTYTFLFALIVIFLILAAQFESFRDPLIILVSVPMAISGALIFLNSGLATMNIYTQVGLVTLIGLISKHGILMVEFANQLQDTQGLGKREAIELAAGIRLRPVLMTTAAMVVAMVPLLLASGAGAKSRFDIGLVIASGMSVGTLFTLFIVPTMYTYLAEERSVQS